ncbi:MAG: DMT family transporter [Deltaproteobacteria bacterium]|nr:DMT family transporter [Deltaproteobacteria bacterium]
MSENKRPRAVLLLITAAVLWSLAGVLIKGVSLPALAVAGYRSAIALPVLLIFFGRRAVDFSAAQWIGGVCYAATVTLFVAATKLTTAGNAILLQYTAPLYVALLSGWVLKERIRWFDWVTIAAVLVGMALFFLDRLSAGGMAGNVLAIASGVAYASLIVALRRQKDASPAGSAILGNLLTALACLPWMAQSVPGGGDWIGLVLLGVFQIGVSYVCYVVAVRSVTAMEAVLVPMIEPILNPLWVLLWMGERPGPWALWGGAVVILAVLFRGIADVRSRIGS